MIHGLTHNRSIRGVALAIALCAVVGCGQPSPKGFADGEVTQTLHPEAVKVVRSEVEHHFGTPQNLVASMMFADDEGNPVIEFGRIEGEVTEASEANDYHLKVTLSGDQTLKPEEIKGLGLIWLSGNYQSAVEVSKKKDAPSDKNAAFRATRFEESADGQGLLSVNYKLEAPVAAKTKFVLVGHRLRRGRSLYMQHCMHCHGYTGGANGPTAKYLNPKPRDYRPGVFKFTSTHARDKASREDLYRIVRQGIPGTYMPSFLLLEDQELKDIIEYVRFLGVRGEYENAVAIALATDYTKEGWERLTSTAEQRFESNSKALREAGIAESKIPNRASYEPAAQLKKFVAGDFALDAESRINRISSNWARANQEMAVVRPTSPRVESSPESIRRGRALFLSTKTNCWECHGTTGRGNGPQTTTYLSKQFGDKKGMNPKPGLFDMWGNPIEPRNFHVGYFRGGRRPIDIYRRIKAGIKGTPMQAFGALPDNQIWDLVNYVLSVPHVENGTMTLTEPGKKKPKAGKQTASNQ